MPIFQPDFDEDYPIPYKQGPWTIPQQIGNILQTPVQPSSSNGMDKSKLLETLGNILSSGANVLPSAANYVGNQGASIADSLKNDAKNIGQYAVDTFTGVHNSVPAGVRFAVAGASKDEDKLATLRQFYPDATMSNGEFTFTDPKLGKKVNLDDPGLSLGDIAGRIPDAGEIAGGAVGGLLGGLLGIEGGPPGMAVGATVAGGATAAGGRELGRLFSKSLGEEATNKQAIDTRSPLDYAGDFVNTASMDSLIPTLPEVGIPAGKAAISEVGSILKKLNEKPLIHFSPEELDSMHASLLKKEADDSVHEVQSFLAKQSSDAADLKDAAYTGEVGRLNQHLDESFAPGARLNEDHTRVTIPEVPATKAHEVYCSKYGDCAPALVKNIYDEFGLPSNILTSKFIQSGFEHQPADLWHGKSGKGNFGTPHENTMPMLDDFGIQHKELFNQGNINTINPSQEQLSSVTSSIDNALDGGSKVMIRQLNAKGVGHVFLITGKDDANGLYVTSGRNIPGPYADSSFKVDPNVDNPLAVGKKPGSEVIPKQAIYADLGLGKENWKYNQPNFNVVQIDGVNKSPEELKKMFQYPSKDNQPVNFGASEKLKLNSLDRMWKRQYEPNSWTDYGVPKNTNPEIEGLAKTLSAPIKKNGNVELAKDSVATKIEPPEFFGKTNPALKFAEQLQAPSSLYLRNISNPKKTLNTYLSNNVAKGARFKHGDDIVSPYDPRVVIPEKKPAYMGSVSYSRYGDCVASVVKNVYSDFGLPDDIMYSKFIKNKLLTVAKKEASTTSSGRGGVVHGGGAAEPGGSGDKLIDDLKGFGLEVERMPFVGNRRYQESIPNDIDEALNNGSKIMVLMRGKGTKSDHVYLISGKDKGKYHLPGMPELGERELDRYITKGRHLDGVPYENNFRALPAARKEKEHALSIYKEVLLDDLGFTEEGNKHNGLSYTLYEIKGIKRNLRDLQEDIYKHRETPPVNLNSNKLLKKHAEIRDKSLSTVESMFEKYGVKDTLKASMRDEDTLAKLKLSKEEKDKGLMWIIHHENSPALNDLLLKHAPKDTPFYLELMGKMKKKP